MSSTDAPSPERLQDIGGDALGGFYRRGACELRIAHGRLGAVVTENPANVTGRFPPSASVRDAGMCRQWDRKARKEKIRE